MDKKINTRNKEKNKIDIPLEIQERARRLRFLRKMTRLSMKEFAQLCTLGLTTINYWEQGYSSITERGSKKVIKALREEGIECSTIWLLSGLGTEPKITDPSKLSKINYPSIETSTQIIREESSDYLSGRIKEELNLFQSIHPDNLVYLINNESMMPLYCKGDIVAGKKLTGKNMELANGIDCIVEIEKNTLEVRRVRIGQATNSFDLYVINSEASLEFPPLRNVKINALAPIIRIWKPGKF
ncbi:helix-turn-helix domain-containing protein [Rickettsiella endosymbiont of Dermanyssus gallinae]|uniref:helix-turn-helix domain-containing protein n=1 Tax=Rickettsiella endosymbiont of Dermanyssus gallinae TaxID=2856608 RepID=UPI001C52EF94|nr:helix-turn-helix transcriptional regulator [Rickettsiella endosymbiont of Dermanyssus gallinae]